jgi:hypothetical protein
MWFQFSPSGTAPRPSVRMSPRQSARQPMARFCFAA